MTKIFFHRKTCIKMACLLLIVLLTIGPIQYVHAAPKFGISQSNSLLAGFHNVAIAANASHVYVAYTDPSFSLGILSSSDNGTTFSGPSLLCGGTCSANQDEQPAIAVSGRHLYVAWFDGDRNIAFAKSDDNGASFPTATSPGPNVGTEVTSSKNEMSGPHIAVSGNDVYLQWINANGKVAFAASHNNGATWDPIKVLSTTSNVFDPQIATAGTNAYVTWEDKSVDASGDINSTTLAKSGTVVESINNLSNTAGQTSAKPHIAAFLNNVYEVWQESGKDIFFTKSINNGTSFGLGINLSNSGGTADNPQIAANATKVYVVWQDTVTGTGTNEIFFKASSDNGTTFQSAINVSGNSGESVFPKISLSGNNVYVVWQDKTIDSTGDILFKASSDGGSTFGGLKKLNSNSNSINDNTGQISASSKNISTIWSDGSNFANYVSATYSPIEVQFSASQYSLNSTATITVTDPSANTNSATLQTVSIVVKSTTNDTGIAVPLDETGDNTGVFSGTIRFASSASTGTTLKASPGDLITATYSGQSSVASIVPITIAFDSPSGYDRGAIAHITVTDPNEHATGVGIPLQKITVHLTSDANPAGVDIQLTETALDSNIFGGATGSTNNLIFMDTNNLFSVPSTVTISQTNTGANTNPAAIDIATEEINSTSDKTGIILRLNETSVNSGVFKGPLSLVTGSSVNHTSIKVSPGDFLRVTRGTATENALITPNSNPSNAALLVTADPMVDTVTASFGGVTKSVTVSRLFDPGGSGGGLVRPGLILEVVASLNGGGNNPIPPLFSLNALAQTAGTLPENIRQEVLKHDPYKSLTPEYDTTFDYPLVIDGGGYVLGGYQNTIQTITEKAGTPVILKLNLPATNLVHLALYTNLGGKSREITDSDTYIIYDKGQPLQKVDPHGLFSSVKFDLDTTGVHNTVQYAITFAKEMAKSDIIFRAWTDIGSSADVKLHDVWEVQAPQVTSSLLPQTQDVASPPLVIVPTPATQPVQSNDLLPAIKDWGGFSSHPISDSELLSHIGLSGKTIPKWVSNAAKYVVNNDMTQQDFENLVKYLVSNGIIK